MRATDFHGAPEVIEPIYIAQSAEPMSKDEAMQWIKEQAAAARERGSVMARASYHPELNIYLFEAWDQVVTEQGEPRWQLTKVN